MYFTNFDIKSFILGAGETNYFHLLSSITFNEKPEAIDVTLFANCPNLVEINVPWGEGEVAGAPWGATNATIHYNR